MSATRARKRSPAVPAEALRLLKLHRKSFKEVVPFATKTGHTVPSDTKSWSQILITCLTGIQGLVRKKGDDFADGSDVKAANLWEAIDTPRLNGVLKSGRKNHVGSIKSLNGMPYLFFVLWDKEPNENRERCRVWIVRPRKDALFRKMASLWYRRRKSDAIKSDNFQLHPPRNKDGNVLRNECGNLEYLPRPCAPT